MRPNCSALLLDHQPHVEVVADAEGAEPARRAAHAVAARLPGAVVVALGREGPARRGGHLDREVGGAGLRALLQARGHLDARLVRQQQHRAFIVRRAHRRAGLQGREEAAHARLGNGRIGSDGHVDLAQAALDHADLDDPVAHGLHRHHGLREEVAALLVARGDRLGELLQVGERDVAADVGAGDGLQFFVAQRLHAVEAQVVELEGRAGGAARVARRRGQALRGDGPRGCLRDGAVTASARVLGRQQLGVVAVRFGGMGALGRDEQRRADQGRDREGDRRDRRGALAGFHFSLPPSNASCRSG